MLDVTMLSKVVSVVSVVAEPSALVVFPELMTSEVAVLIALVVASIPTSLPF